jgi:hypothetical protein
MHPFPDPPPPRRDPGSAALLADLELVAGALDRIYEASRRAWKQLDDLDQRIQLLTTRFRTIRTVIEKDPIPVCPLCSRRIEVVDITANDDTPGRTFFCGGCQRRFSILTK